MFKTKLIWLGAQLFSSQGDEYFRKRRIRKALVSMTTRLMCNYCGHDTTIMNMGNHFKTCTKIWFTAEREEGMLLVLFGL